MEMIDTMPTRPAAAPFRTGRRRLHLLRQVRTLALVGAIAAASLASGSCWARPMAVVDSYPKVNQIMDGEATSFVLRFDGPVDHASARLTLMTPAGPRSLKARLGSQPSTLFAAVGKLPAGTYSLAWQAKARDGEISTGSIQFSVTVR